MGRMYTAPFSAIAVTAVQDFFEVTAAAGKPLTIHQVVITQSVSETNEQFEMVLKIAASGFTSGSGGGSATIAKLSSTDPAAAATVERNNTTQASGTLATIWAEGIPSQGGFSYFPTPESRPVIHSGEAFLVCLGNAPAASTTFSGVVVFEEL